MLQITLTEGTELKIGDDVRVIFREAAFGRARVAVDAPKEKSIKRIDPESSAEETSGTRRATGEKGTVYITRSGKGTVTKKKDGSA